MGTVYELHFVGNFIYKVKSGITFSLIKLDDDRGVRIQLNLLLASPIFTLLLLLLLLIFGILNPCEFSFPIPEVT